MFALNSTVNHYHIIIWRLEDDGGKNQIKFVKQPFAPRIGILHTDSSIEFVF